MTTINTRASVLGIKVESTEGTPALPSATTDFIAQQDDLSMEPSFEQLENAELKNSLGRAKTIVGAETPTASFSHYLRHSGTEGVAPKYGSTVLKAILGTETVDADEETTAAACTTSLIKLTGSGEDHPRGSGMLIKDATNGYSIRPAHSVSTNDVTLGFNLSDAPGSGVTVGKCVTYSVADTGHQTLSLWEYLGNGGAVELISGARPVSMDISLEANQLANASFSFEGIGFYFNPITISDSNKYIDFNEGAASLSATLTTETYKDPHDLADHIATVMNALATATITCTYSDTTGKYTIASDGATFELEWKTGTNGSDGTDAHVGTTLGFSDAADDTGATSYTSDNAVSWAASYTPSYESADPIVCKGFECFIGEAEDNDCFDPSSVSISVSTPKVDTMSLCSDSGKSGSIISAREVTIDVVTLLPQHCADRFRRMRENTETRFFIAGGPKSGGNYEAGKCFGIYAPTCTVTSLSIADSDGRAEMSISLSTYVDDSGNGEFYIFFV
jgi:hypothetical protein